MNARTAMRLAALVLAGLAACTKSPVTVTQSEGVMPADHPPVALPPVSRSPRRLDVDQLLASVTVVASDDGSIQWNQDKASIQRVLGKPDFVQVTDEDLSPSTLYLKFIDDLAHDVCNKMVAVPSTSQVLMRYAGPTDTLASNPTAVQQNLRYLYLRFFGRKIPDSDTTIFAPMLKVFDTVTTAEMTDKSLSKSTTPATEGWRAVCIAGFTSPDFNLY
jgi:hypothetical protein